MCSNSNPFANNRYSASDEIQLSGALRSGADSLRQRERLEDSEFFKGLGKVGLEFRYESQTRGDRKIETK